MTINVWNQTSHLAKIRNLKDKDIALWSRILCTIILDYMTVCACEALLPQRPLAYTDQAGWVQTQVDLMFLEFRV